MAPFLTSDDPAAEDLSCLAADERDGSLAEDLQGDRPGSILDDFLAEEGLLEEVTERSVNSVLA